LNLLDIGYALTALVTAPWWMRKTRSGWSERFARTLPDLPGKAPGRPRIMLHAVSVGEVNALRELVPRLAREAEVVLSVSTDTGIARARGLFAGSACCVTRYPLDASWAVRRFLDRVQPDAVGLVELEVWPNFVGACARRGIPVAVINGRLSERSFRGYRRISRWISSSFAALSLAAVQDETYAERFTAMGVPRDRVVVTGSMKFDTARIEDGVEGSERLGAELGIDRSRPLIVAGSTGPGEEALLRDACARAFGRGHVQLLCAPRKPERFDEAAGAMPGCVRRSACPPVAPPSDPPLAGVRGPVRMGGNSPPPDYFLLDTIGELRKAYALADVVVVGRSFFDLHGSDPIEPIGLGRATIIGSAVAHFGERGRAWEGAGGLVRADRSDLAETLGTLLADPDGRRTLAERGRACIRSMQGATDRHAELLLWLAGADGPAVRPGILPGEHSRGDAALRSPSTRA